MELKQIKRGDREEEEEDGRWEKGGTGGYLKDISQNVGEEKTDKKTDRET